MGLGLFWDNGNRNKIVGLGLYVGNGKENGGYYGMMGLGVRFLEQS